MKPPLSKKDGSADEIGHYRTGTSASSDRSIMCPVPHAKRGDRVSEGTARVATADPVTAVTESQPGAGFAVVARARSTLSIASDDEKATSDNYKARTVSSAIKTTTETDYRAKADLLAAAMTKLPDSRKKNLNDMVCAVLAPYAPRSSSFYSMRRALVWSIDRKIEAKIKTQDKLQRKKPINGAWLIEIRQLENFCNNAKSFKRSIEKNCCWLHSKPQNALHLKEKTALNFRLIGSCALRRLLRATSTITQ